MIINVTEANIKAGTRNHCNACPIAIAIFRATNQHTVVTWDKAVINGVEYKLPEEAMRFIDTFDIAGKAWVEPFSFELNI